MKAATPNYLQFDNFATATALLMDLFWRVVLLYTLLFSMCLGGNCGMWTESALAAPQQTLAVTSVTTTDTTWSKADRVYQVTEPFRAGRDVRLTIMR